MEESKKASLGHVELVGMKYNTEGRAEARKPKARMELGGEMTQQLRAPAAF